MKREMICLLLAVVFLLPAAAGAVTEEDFQVKDTQSLINLCTATPDDPRYDEAIHFCQGYLVGAFHYYKVTHSGPDKMPMVCFPEPPPSRNDAVTMFINWAKAHRQHMNEVPVETEFRFLIETWPCN
jgi:hypothetical protein